MSKQNSIRSAANSMFLQLLPSRKEVGNKAFRRNVMHYLVETFECTVPAAATHYNYAFQRVKEGMPELVAGLGRAEGKNNGGRKKKVALTAAELTAPLQAPELDPMPEEQQVFSVKRKNDGETIAEGMNFDDARAMVNKAAAAKKSKLYWV